MNCFPALSVYDLNAIVDGVPSCALHSFPLPVWRIKISWIGFLAPLVAACELFMRIVGSFSSASGFRSLHGDGRVGLDSGFSLPTISVQSPGFLWALHRCASFFAVPGLRSSIIFILSPHRCRHRHHTPELYFRPWGKEKRHKLLWNWNNAHNGVGQ